MDTRFRPGAENRAAKLDPDKVASIRRAHLWGASLRKIARRWGITYSHAGKIVRGEKWKSVPLP